MRIELIKRIWINRSSIFEGIYNRLFSSKKVKELAKKRLEVCKFCSFNSDNTTNRPEGKLPYKHCTECGCSLHIKPYAETTECPNGFWEKVLNN